MRYILRLAVLALGAYGVWKLYEQYGHRLQASRGDLDDFGARAKRSAHEAAERVTSAAGDATEAVAESTADIKTAARDAQEKVTQNLRDERAASKAPSS